MTTPAIHVVSGGTRRWAVEREGGARPMPMHPTHAEASRAGRALAPRDRVEFIVHGKNGQIRTRYSYGNDPIRRRADALGGRASFGQPRPEPLQSKATSW
jgi:hypothetical protein